MFDSLLQEALTLRSLNIRLALSVIFLINFAAAASAQIEIEYGEIDPFGLRRDPRLEKRIRIIADNPSMQELLSAVARVTGVTFSVDPKLRDHCPYFGRVRIKNGKSWSVLELLSRQQLENGRWIKTKGGYQLTAKASTPAKFRIKRKSSRTAPGAIMSFQKKYTTRIDHRLGSKLTIDERNPKLTKILFRLQNATGLSFTVADSVGNHDPQFGHVQLHNAYAWMVMEMIANRQLKNGRWQKTADGYMLTGTSTAPSAQAQSGGWSVARIIAGVIIAVGGLAFAVFCALALFRRPASGPERTASK